MERELGHRTLNLSTHKTIISKLAIISRVTGTSINDLVNDALTTFIDNIQKKPDYQEKLAKYNESIKPKWD